MSFLGVKISFELAQVFEYMPQTKQKTIHVVAAVIRNGFGQILLAQRSLNCPHLPGYWEFPGGKMEEGENPQQALVRELQEEIGITATKLTPLIQVPYSYPEKDVVLDVWEVDQYMGEIKPCEGQELVFCGLDEMVNYQLPPADLPVITALTLPQAYLITPEPADYSVDEFAQRLRAVIDKGISLVQLRSKSLPSAELAQYAQVAKDVCHAANAKILVNSDVKIYKNCALDGVHLSSNQVAAGKQIDKTKDKDLIVASCHTLNELKQAEQLGVDFALLSPVKKTMTHPDVTPLGWSNFADAIQHVAIPVYALGGMKISDIQIAKESGAQGVAAIRGLWDI